MKERYCNILDFLPGSLLGDSVSAFPFPLTCSVILHSHNSHQFLLCKDKICSLEQKRKSSNNFDFLRYLFT